MPDVNLPQDDDVTYSMVTIAPTPRKAGGEHDHWFLGIRSRMRKKAASGESDTLLMQRYLIAFTCEVCTKKL